MLDMHHDAHDQPTGLHGAQVGVGSVVAGGGLAAPAVRLRPGRRRPRRALPRPGEPARHRCSPRSPTSTRAARVGEECWSDYEAKLTAWAQARPTVRGGVRATGSGTGPSSRSVLVDPATLGHGAASPRARRPGSPTWTPPSTTPRHAGPSATATSCATGSPSSTCSTCSAGGPTTTSPRCSPRPTLGRGKDEQRREPRPGHRHRQLDHRVEGRRVGPQRPHGRGGTRDLRAQLTAAGLGRAEPRGLVDRDEHRDPAGGADRRRPAARRPLHHPPARDVRLRHRGRPPLRPAMLWLDSRATAGGRASSARPGAPGHRQAAEPDARLVQAALAARATSRRPWSAPQRVVDVQAYLVHRITRRSGARRWASADPLGVLDMRTFDYDDELLGAVGLPARAAAGAVRARRGARRRSRPTLGRRAGPAARACRWWRASATASRRGWAPASSSPGSAYLNLGTGLISGTFSETYSTGIGVPGPVRRRAAHLRLRDASSAAAPTTSTGSSRSSAGVDPLALRLDLSAEQILETAAAQLPPGAERPARAAVLGAAR